MSKKVTGRSKAATQTSTRSTGKRVRKSSGQAMKKSTVRKKADSKWLKAGSELVCMLWQPRMLMTLLMLMGLFYLVSKIDLNASWPVKAVTIEGEFKYLDKQVLREQAMPLVNGGLFSVDLPAIREHLIELSWVEDVSIRRQWPDGLLIRVIEKQPVVYWGKKSLVSARGQLFTPDVPLTIVLPKLNGPEGQHQYMLKELARMQAWLLETNLEIYSMTLDARRSWTLSLSGGIELRLGRKQTHERVNRFVSVYKNNLQQQKRDIKHIDMRYTNGFALAWKEA